MKSKKSQPQLKKIVFGHVIGGLILRLMPPGSIITDNQLDFSIASGILPEAHNLWASQPTQ